MSDEIKKELEKEILSELKDLSDIETGSKEKDTAIENLATLYKLNIEENKIEREALDKAYDRGLEDEKSRDDLAFKQKQLRESKIDRYFRTALEAAGIALPLAFYAVWMKRGLSFEETGTFTSTTFKGLVSRFKPTKK